jgi:hypothetical protein
VTSVDAKAGTLTVKVKEIHLTTDSKSTKLRWKAQGR